MGLIEKAKRIDMQFKDSNYVKTIKSKLASIDFISPLLFRLILAPTMIIAGFNKLNLGNTDVSLPVSYTHLTLPTNREV